MEPEGSLLHLLLPATFPYTELDWSRPCPHPTSWRSILIFSSHLHLVLPSSLPSSFATKTLYAPLLSPMCATASQPHSWFNHPNNIGWGVQIMKLFVMWFSPLSCYLIPLRPKYFPQQPVLKHPQLMFIPQYEWPSFKTIQNNRENYSSLYINVYIFG
jgi:hypothetical protein